MPNAPRVPGRREVLKYAGTTGVAAAGLGLLNTPSAAAEPAAAADATVTPAVCKPLDIVVFGDADSEAAHALTTTRSDTVTGGLGQSARVLNPSDPVSYWGGTLKFEAAVSPAGTTYVTVRLWGDDYDTTSQQAASGTNMWRLQLFCDGLQVGYQDEGAVDSLDILDTSPRTPGRFFFHTLPLPERMTSGKKKVTLEIRAMGRIWSYGQNADQLYYKMTTPSRGIYRLYTHTEPYFVPPKGEVQGPAPEPKKRTVEGPEALEAVRKRVDKDQRYYLTAANPAGMDAFAFQSLAEGYLWSGSPAYRKPEALDRVLRAIDGRYLAWKSDQAVLTGSDQQWQGFGRVGLVLALLWEHLGDRLDAKVTGSPYEIANPGFEDGGDTPTGWEVPGWGRTADATWSRDTAVSRSGSASLKVTATAAGGFITVYSSPKARVGKGIHTYGAWIRTDGVTGTGAHIDPLFFDANGKLVGSDHRRFAATGTHGWEYVSLDLDTPDGATQVEFHLRLSGPGTAWFDDLVVTAPAGTGGPEQPPVRRDAYIDMLKSSRDYWRQHFPHYTNQSQICAIGIYQANRGLALLAPELALPEKRARDYMYQSLGMKPYLGKEDADGKPTKPLGEGYYQVTRAGLTRELGYVGSYGEVIDWLVMMYESVTRGHGGQEAPELREQMIKIIKARGRFRVVDVDETGARVSRIETVVGWRNEVYPGEIAYASRTAWDSHPVMSAAVFKDPEIVGWTQEMVADGQFYKQLDLLIHHSWTRVGLAGLRLVSRDWDAFQALPARPGRVPTAWDRPDFVFTDEENGVLAVKNGRELLFVSLYWRARQGVNDYARIHHLTPTDQRSATVRQRSAGTTGDTFTVRDWILWDYAINDPGAGHIPPGGFPPPGDTLHQSQKGDVHRLAPVPADVPDPAVGVHFDGVETMLVGRAPFYLCEYGDYLIAMNTSADKTFTLPARQAFGPAQDLATGRTVGAGQRPEVGPRSTLVLYRGRRTTD